MSKLSLGLTKLAIQALPFVKSFFNADLDRNKPEIYTELDHLTTMTKMAVATGELKAGTYLVDRLKDYLSDMHLSEVLMVLLNPYLTTFQTAVDSLPTYTDAQLDGAVAVLKEHLRGAHL